MKLTFLYHPVKDIKQAVAFYRDVLAWEEAWRMGEDTAAMKMPGTEIVMMLALDADPSAAASGFFEVEDVDSLMERIKDRVAVADEPQDLPPIRYAAFRDPDGNLIRVFTSTEEA